MASGVGSAFQIREMPTSNNGGGTAVHRVHGPYTQPDSAEADHKCARARAIISVDFKPGLR